ncbi:hypothetical protein BESB_070880 [Besnoitia besnoiti]|uniref:Peroxisomal ATPase PEX1 N-terminal C-lobe domain-containing protein n=1 Tax=Besnoitia besnoiti TaxID=94643 RepID=A0A2A9MDA6_BESBE|nr:uncharacterized protein BESB_070880 [Besnoitia besnoiti]PFH33936.1 hypothetical protein BESB_070880 [Besnoitia besnoiti]
MDDENSLMAAMLQAAGSEKRRINCLGVRGSHAAESHEEAQPLFLGISAALCECYGLQPWDSVELSFIDFGTAPDMQLEPSQTEGSAVAPVQSVSTQALPPRQLTSLMPAQVELRCVTAADWDLVELQAQQIEERLLLQTAVLMPGIPFPVWFHNGQQPARLCVVREGFAAPTGWSQPRERTDHRGQAGAGNAKTGSTALQSGVNSHGYMHISVEKDFTIALFIVEFP